MSFTYEEIKKYVEIESDSGCKLLSTEYHNAKSKLFFKCKCGNVFQTNMNMFKSRHKQQCNKCSKEEKRKAQRISYLDVVTYVKNNSDCILLSKEYKGEDKNLKFRCSCGKIFYRTFGNFKQKKNKVCLDCVHKIMGINELLSNDKVQKLLNEKGYKLIGNYQKSNKPIVVEDQYGYLYKATLHNLLYRGNARKFAQSNPYTINNLNLWIKLNDKSFELLSKNYTSSREANLTFKCKKCDFIWNASCNNIIQKNVGCPQCKQSTGEIRIEKYLKLNNIKYIPQMSFEGLIGLGGGLLSYDFYLPNQNLLIEYQGGFHDGSGNAKNIQTEEMLNRQKEHDYRKKQYAINNNIGLLEIWYDNYNNIEDILYKELKLNTITSL